MRRFFYGFVMGIIISHIIGFFSLYDMFATIIDKPFINTHGTCIILSIGACYFVYEAVHTLTQNYYRECQDMIQKSISSFDKTINKALKIIEKK